MKQVELLGLQSAASSVVSVPFDLGDLDKFAVQVIFSGGAGNLIGNLTLEASADEAPAVNFVTITGTLQAVTSSVNHTWNVQGAAYRFVRVRWAAGSGTGNMRASITAKETVVKGA